MTMNSYPVRWVKLEKFCELTGYTEEAVRQNRKKGIWLEGRIVMNRNRRLYVNVQEYDRWIEAKTISAAA